MSDSLTIKPERFNNFIEMSGMLNTYNTSDRYAVWIEVDANGASDFNHLQYYTLSCDAK